ncbi:MAG TPA: Asp23/Gls24 family envelope stress response protein [Gaiellaceae bacterium]|nr:Asp23/Gls24 family envelope stress response protein [Gaiellaceae bacterium]
MTDPLVFRGPEGAITVTPAALTRLVARAAQSVDGARVRRPKRAVEVVSDGDRVAVVLELTVTHGEPVPELARSVQERVGDAIGRLSGLEVERVDVEITEVV